jgi:hypothetical protein
VGSFCSFARGASGAKGACSASKYPQNEKTRYLWVLVHSNLVTSCHKHKKHKKQELSQGHSNENKSQEIQA